MRLNVERMCRWLTGIVMVLSACQPDAAKDKSTPPQTESAPAAPPLFTLLPPQQTGIDFVNALTEGLNTNVLMYEYFYNGGGVAVGDVNNDGLDDVYFTANMAPNRLYLNRGNMQFTDITAPAGVAGRENLWKTGVTMADVNGDGWLDMYVCRSGNLPPEKRANELFINQGPDANGIPHFTEQAAAYGLDHPGTSTHATFFDYDRDGDLDMLLLNHNPRQLPVLNHISTAKIMEEPDPLTGVRLLRNDAPHPPTPSPTEKGRKKKSLSAGRAVYEAANGFRVRFTDVTEKAGLSSSALTYGLGTGIADLNGDGWPDMYICNDYAVPDYLYINNQNGTFINQLPKSLGHTSHFSMGNDVSDVNNDGLPDIFTLDMLPEDNRRQKLLFAPDNYAKFDLNLRSGFYYQFMRNMLHISNGNGTFSEVGQLAGISNTDWSWSALFADFDNDGWKDLHVTNGYLRDFTNMDFIKYMDGFVQQKGRLKRTDVLELVHQIPASNVTNYLYRNNGNLTFTNQNTRWGINRPSNSNGAAYADLDNDGDLDLVVNNINQPAFIYRNESDSQTKHRYLRIKLAGAGQNTKGIGAKITVYHNGKQQFQEQMPARGYQSSVSPVLHFGLGTDTLVDSLRIVWLSGKQEVLRDVKSNQLLMLDEKNARSVYRKPKLVTPVFTESPSPVAFTHQTTPVNDFKRQPLLVNPLSFNGPCLVKGDVNGDGLEDVFAGGGSGQAGALYLQRTNGTFRPISKKAFEADKMSEDADALFFDANGDTFPDLYVCSGGYGRFTPDDSLLQDRLYLNDGKGNFTKRPDALPDMRTSTSCVRAADVNGDGHLDVFVGGRVIPGRYPETPRSYVLINDGKGRFTDQTSKIAPGLQQIGMVTDAAWHDLNNDSIPELIVVGEWMPVTVFQNKSEKLTINYSFTQSLIHSSGWWNKLLVHDFNHDGKADLVIGNLGENTQCKVNEKEPAELYYKDFDDNGSVDPILCFYVQGKSYPYVTRDELLGQLGIMRTRFTNYKSYADATLTDIFTADQLKNAEHLSATHLRTAYFENTGNGTFTEKALPVEAQFSPVYGMAALDYDGDGNQDLLLGGNITNARLRFGKYDASYGTLLKSDGNGNFTYVPQQQSGLKVKGDVRSILTINNTVLFGVNQQPMQAYRYRRVPDGSAKITKK